MGTRLPLLGFSVSHNGTREKFASMDIAQYRTDRNFISVFPTGGTQPLRQISVDMVNIVLGMLKIAHPINHCPLQFFLKETDKTPLPEDLAFLNLHKSVDVPRRCGSVRARLL